MVDVKLDGFGRCCFGRETGLATPQTGPRDYGRTDWTLAVTGLPVLRW